MTLYYVTQDNTVWGCGNPECCGEYIEEIESTFVEIEGDVNEDIIQDEIGGGPVLKFRKAKAKEILAFYDGEAKGYNQGFVTGFKHSKLYDA